MTRAIVGRVAVAVEPGLEGRVLAAADRARDEDEVAPHDRARMREAGDRRAPQDVLTGRGVPSIGKVLALRDPRGFGTAERRPVTGARGSRRQRASSGTGDARDRTRPDVHGYAPWQPLAAIEDHAAHGAVVFDERKADARSVDRELVDTRIAAVLRRVLQRQRHFTAAQRPRAGHRRPAGAGQGEGAGRIELQREVADDERIAGEFRLRGGADRDQRQQRIHKASSHARMVSPPCDAVSASQRHGNRDRSGSSEGPAGGCRLGPRLPVQGACNGGTGN